MKTVTWMIANEASKVTIEKIVTKLVISSQIQTILNQNYVTSLAMNMTRKAAPQIIKNVQRRTIFIIITRKQKTKMRVATKVKVTEAKRASHKTLVLILKLILRSITKWKTNRICHK